MSVVLVAGFLALSLATLSASGSAKPEGYLAEPKSGKGPGVLVLHPWWGLNADTKAFCDRLADSGFVAFAPDMFHGQTATTPEAAEALTKAHRSKEAEIKAQILESAKYLEERTGKKEIAVVGFSYGAYYALDFSNAEPTRVRALVDFYGTGEEDFSQSKASYLGHFAEKDEFEPKESVDSLAKALKEAGRPATIHTYSGTGHWFFEPSVKAAYNKEASDLAWARTLGFLRTTLGTEAD
ncbi:dienelactone hydrolase family protein [bacterium]|nr:MAG: dienelactone hydrolase family protein [bacterium]